MFSTSGTLIRICHRVKDGVEGGEVAAQNMKDAIKKQLKKIYPGKNTDNWQIVVWYITALDGLASVYQGYLSQKTDYTGVNFRESLRRFAIGLNRGADYNFNFVDVGGGKDLKLKEITDAKLRETFKTSECWPRPIHGKEEKSKSTNSIP